MSGVRPRWVDFHCHLDLYPDHQRLVWECERAEIATLAVTTTPKAWAGNQAAVKGACHVRVGLGLHPQLIAERAGELRLFETLLPTAKYVGEIGIDAGPRYFRSLEAQEAVFASILQRCAEQGGKVLTVHSVRSAKRVLDHVERSRLPPSVRVVLHWFSGTMAEAKRAADIGCYFSIGPGMLASPNGRKLASSLPLDRILTETDGPFVQVAGRIARPRDVSETVEELALTRSLETDEVRRQILTNLASLVGPIS